MLTRKTDEYSIRLEQNGIELNNYYMLSDKIICVSDN